MHGSSGGDQLTVGYVGTAWPLGEASTGLDERSDYTVQRLSIDDLDEVDVDVLVVDDDRVDAVAERIGAEPVALIAIGADETLTITSDTLDGLDGHVVVEDDDLSPLVDALDDAVGERWRNLGMPPDRFLDAVFERAPAHLYVKDTDGRHVRVSEFYNSPEDLVGLTDREVYGHETFAQQAYEDDMQVIESGEPIIEKEEFNPGDDNWTITSKTPVTDRSGDAVGLIGFTQLITTRKEYEKALERQNDRLEQFSQILSHDLRNPLSVANGHLEIAREADPDNERLDDIAESLDRIDELVEDVLTLTRGGQRVVDVERVSLQSVCTSCWEMVSTADATLSVADVTIEADRGRLRHVFENLFRNAVEHGGEGVSVTIGPLDGDDGFHVADDGPGIPAGDREQIFERGYTTSSDGTGLGLEIVRQIVDAHEWEIDVREGDAGGTRFEISGVAVVE